MRSLFKGRLGRAAFAIRLFPVLVFFALENTIIAYLNNLIPQQPGLINVLVSVLGALIFLFLVVYLIGIVVRRGHDLGYSGKTTAIIIILTLIFLNPYGIILLGQAGFPAGGPQAAEMVFQTGSILAGIWDIILFLYLVFKKGQREANAYGPAL